MQLYRIPGAQCCSSGPNNISTISSLEREGYHLINLPLELNSIVIRLCFQLFPASLSLHLCTQRQIKDSLHQLKTTTQCASIILMFNFAAQTHTHISVDCIKACPFVPNLFALAYYQTNPDTQGAIAVARIETPQDLQLIHPHICPPLLHLVWVAVIGRDDVFLLAAASRTNDVLIYQYTPSSNTLALLKTLQVGQSIFCLYLDMQAKQNHYRLLVSSNESTVVDITLTATFQIIERRQYSKHEYAVWTCRLNPISESFVCGDEVNSIYLYNHGQLVGKNNKTHTGGICDLTFAGQHTLYTGGFDGIVSIIDVRKFGQCIYSHNYGGTIWRVIPNEKLDKILLCNSSQKKFQIVNQDLSTELWNSSAHHDSLAYAADWGSKSLITASFYDKKICFWEEGKIKND